jgi:hypothetical protein
MRLRTIRRVGALVVLAVATVGCWPQPGADAGNSKRNGVESALTAANVASLEEAWSARGRVSAVVGGRAIGAVDGRPVRVVARDVATGEELWAVDATASDHVGAVTHEPVVAGGTVWVSWAAAAPTGECVTGNAGYDTRAGYGTYIDFVIPATELRAGGGALVRQHGDLRPSADGGCERWPDSWPFLVADATSNVVRWQGDRTVTEAIVAPGGGGGGERLVGYEGAAVSGWPAAGCPGIERCAPSWALERPGDVVDLAAAGEAWVAVLAEAPADGSLGATLALVDAVTGAEVVGGSRAPDGPRSVAIGEDAYVLGASEVTASALDVCGPGSCPLLWTATLGGPASTTADLALAGGVLYVPREDGVVEAYDVAACGAAGEACAAVAEVAVDGPVTGLTVAQGRLFVSHGDAVTAFAPTEPAGPG